MVNSEIGIIGLGYVGLPLAVAFGKKRKVIGYDIDRGRIDELIKGIDRTREVTGKDLKLAEYLTVTGDHEALKNVGIYIITVPTPIDEFKKPDLRPLKKASEIVGQFLKRNDLVIYESTVYPGCTEEVCVPILESKSGLRYNQDFFCGYSPERINPGDKIHTVESIKKVTSGSNEEIAEVVDKLYQEIVHAGTHKASSIKVAEAAKVIENSQRDINIAFVNELAMIFDKMGIDTKEVLDAAGTKWNFLPFKPGLVGGHCIGVDPYYLTYKAESIGYHPQVILSGRRINDHVGVFVANSILKLMVKKKHTIVDSKALVLGITFKEDCPDIRNSKVIDVIRELESFGIKVDTMDGHADKVEVREQYGIELIDDIDTVYDVVVLAVAHKDFEHLNLKELSNNNSVIYDIKGFLEKNSVDKRL